MIRFCATLACALALAAPAAGETLVVRGRVHVGDGEVLEDGALIIQDGKLAQVIPVPAQPQWPEGARIVQVPGAELTPGLIDASGVAVSTREWVYAEQTDEVIPHLRVLDALVFDSDEWDHQARWGVTTVCVTADATSVIGARTATLKTAGPREARVLVEAGQVKAAFSQETWYRGARNRRPFGDVPFSTRRPTTRMGMVWVFRDAFAQARAGQLTGPAGDALRQVLGGELGLRIQARHQKDLETAFRLTAELGLEGYTLEEATEIYRCLDDPQVMRALQQGSLKLIYGPIFEQPRGERANTDEANRPCLTTPAKLAAAGVPFALTAADRIGSESDGLAAQAMMAMRYGLKPADALAAVTTIPAQMLGVADRVGALRPGLDADVVVWNGAPFAATSRPVMVLIDGRAVFDDVPTPESTEPQKQRFK